MTAKAGDAKLRDVSADLAVTLAHHDAEIESLGKRMGGIEEEVCNLSAAIQKGFANVGERLSTINSERGPGIGNIMTFVATGGAIVAMASGAITVLVTSFVSPPVTKLQGEVSRLTYYVDRREEVDRQDYIELRRLRDRSVSDDIRTLEKQLRQIEQRAAVNLRPSATP